MRRRFGRRLPLRWHKFVTRHKTLRHFYGPGVTRGPLARWWFLRKHGFICSDQILHENWKLRGRP